MRDRCARGVTISCHCSSPLILARGRRPTIRHADRNQPRAGKNEGQRDPQPGMVDGKLLVINVVSRRDTPLEPFPPSLLELHHRIQRRPSLDQLRGEVGHRTRRAVRDGEHHRHQNPHQEDNRAPRRTVAGICPRMGAASESQFRRWLPASRARPSPTGWEPLPICRRCIARPALPAGARRGSSPRKNKAIGGWRSSLKSPQAATISVLAALAVDEVDSTAPGTQCGGLLGFRHLNLGVRRGGGFPSFSRYPNSPQKWPPKRGVDRSCPARPGEDWTGENE